jgi:N-acetylneuraminic acid mutarotase
VAAVDGKLYVMGGSDNKGNLEATATSLNTAVRGTVPSAPPTLDLTETPEEVEVTIQWTEVAPMPTPRCYGATAVVDNIIYTIGGLENKPITGRVVEAYDPVTNQWATKASLPEGRFNMSAAAYNGKIYIFGGVNTELEVVDTVDVYDIATDTWTAGIATLLKPAAGVAAVTAGDMIYLFGGSRNPMMFVPSSYYFSDVYEFDPVALTFTAGTPMPVSRNMSFVGIVGDGICVIGGVESTGATSNNQYATPAFSIWALKQRIKEAEDNGDLALANSLKALLAEREAGSEAAAWEEKAEMPEKRGGHSGAVVRDPLENCDVYVIGGHAESSVLVYDSETDEWQNATECEIGRNICYVGVAEASPESIYVIGGMDSKGNVVSSVEKGTPYEGTPPSEPEPELPPSEPETTPPPSGPDTTPPPSEGEGMGCGQSSVAKESFDFSPILLGVVWMGAAIALGSRRKRNK